MHKILYACLADYKLNKLVDIVEQLLSSTTNTSTASSSHTLRLSRPALRAVRPGEALPRHPLAVVGLLKSLARFLALYLVDTQRPLFVYSVQKPTAMPNLIDELGSSSGSSGHHRRRRPLHDYTRVELSRARLVRASSNQQQTRALLTLDKCVELLVVCGLFDEAVFVLEASNDWKSSLLLAAILHESNSSSHSNEDETTTADQRVERALIQRVSTLLCLGGLGDEEDDNNDDESLDLNRIGNYHIS